MFRAQTKKYYFFVFLWLSANLHFFASAYEKIIYIIPPSGYDNEKLFDMADTIYNRDDCMRPFYALREKLRHKGYDLKTINWSTAQDLPCFCGLIVCQIPTNREQLNVLKQYPLDQLILLLLEPPTVVPNYYDPETHAYFGKTFTMFDELIDNIRYFKLFYPQIIFGLDDNMPSFHEKKFCTLIASKGVLHHPLELYSERRKIIHFFEQYHPQEFDLYGKGWNSDEFPSYKGSIVSKKETLKNYRFCICYENTKDVYGYVTEKIFDVMMAGCVPIYKGAINIAIYVDHNCFINRDDFVSDQELYQYLKSIDASTYQKYLDAIRLYLQSEKAAYFSAGYFIQTIFKALIPQ